MIAVLPRGWKKAAILIALLVAQPAFAHEVEPGKVEVGDPLVVDANNGLNLRPQPNSGLVGVIPNKAVIYTTGAPEKHSTGRLGNRYWAPVKFQNESGEWTNGWILLKHTSVAPEAKKITPDKIVFGDANDDDGLNKTVVQEPAAKDEKPEPAESAVLTINVGSAARLRAGPGSRNTIINKLSNGTKVKIIGKPRGSWIPIRTGDDKLGWVHMSLLSSGNEKDKGIGKFNPYEIAKGHPRSADAAKEEIAEYAKNQASEGGVAATCDASCRNKGLKKIEISKEDSDGDDDIDADLVVPGAGYIMPVAGKILSRFGPRHGKLHNGIDIRARTPKRVNAIRGGRVVKVKRGCKGGRIDECGGGWGNHVIVDHGNGVQSVYAHLSTVNVKKGDKVGQGTKIAVSGNSGRSYAPHLHLEIHQNGIRKNPLKFLKI